jgi:glutamate-5-semialdehyde dehydrogenase
LKRVSVPFGVIGMIFEARPNVTFDVFSLCFKSGNAAVLKGGKEADGTNRAEVAVIHEVLKKYGVDPHVVELLPATHEATGAMLTAVGYIDLCIPRGSKRLISFVRDTAKVPVIETGAGVVHCYFDETGDLEKGKRIVDNAKTRRCTVCNTLDTLLINSHRLKDLPALVAPMAPKGVKLHADSRAYAALEGKYPDDLLVQVNDPDIWYTEWLSMQMGVCTVDNLDEALQHIATYGSGHSESIVTEDKAHAQRFEQMVDAACVYVNAPTSFTDGAQFGLGAEIGISTQKLGARGPMALEEITTYKWLIEGNGQVRN